MGYQASFGGRGGIGRGSPVKRGLTARSVFDSGSMFVGSSNSRLPKQAAKISAGLPPRESQMNGRNHQGDSDGRVRVIGDIGRGRQMGGDYGRGRQMVANGRGRMMGFNGRGRMMGDAGRGSIMAESGRGGFIGDNRNGRLMGDRQSQPPPIGRAGGPGYGPDRRGVGGSIIRGTIRGTIIGGVDRQPRNAGPFASGASNGTTTSFRAGQPVSSLPPNMRGQGDENRQPRENGPFGSQGGRWPSSQPDSTVSSGDTSWARRVRPQSNVNGNRENPQASESSSIERTPAENRASDGSDWAKGVVPRNATALDIAHGQVDRLKAELKMARLCAASCKCGAFKPTETY